MRSRLLPSGFVVVASLLTFGGVGCRNDVHVQSSTYHLAPTAGKLVETEWNTPRTSPWEGMSGTTLEPTAPVPSAIGGGPPASPPLPPTLANPPTGANDEGNPNMSEEPLPAKPDASEQAAGVTPSP